MGGVLVSINEWNTLDLNGPVVGIDEAGRGAWAGPVSVAAVVLPDGLPTDLLVSIRDSKRMSPSKRESVGGQIRQHALWSVTGVAHQYIDNEGLARAVADAAYHALRVLLDQADCLWPAAILLDGNETNWQKLEPLLERLGIRWYYMVRADDLVKCVAAASVIAKTRRDEWMRGFAKQYPAYGFERNFGYGTPEHIKALEINGISPIHRRSYRPMWQWVPVHERLAYRNKRWRGE